MVATIENMGSKENEMQKKNDDNYLVKKFWSRVLLMLKHQNIPHKDFAEALGITPQDLSNRFKDSSRNISLELALKVSDFFAVPVYRFIDSPTGPLVFKKEQQLQESMGVEYKDEFLEQFHNDVDCILQYTPLMPDRNMQPFELIRKLGEYAEELVKYVNQGRFSQETLFMYEATHGYYNDSDVKEVISELCAYNAQSMEKIEDSKYKIESLLRTLFDRTVQYGLFGFEILIEKGFSVKFPDERTYNNNNRGCRALFINKYWGKLEEFKAKRKK